MATERKWFIRNIAEVPWRQFPDHFGGALSKPLVMPETAGSRHIDYRISMYQPMAYVKVHRHKVQEQVYHVLEGEALMEIDGANHVVRKHYYIFLPPGVDHSILNTGLVDLVFLVVTSPVTDDVTLVSSPCRRSRRRAPRCGPRGAPMRTPRRDGGRAL
jgi:mannose-6-phosphate isomerase-like protein (cupin superfamily)